jgi:hypothetical protein
MAEGETMTATVLQGSKQEIVDRIMQMPGNVREVIVVVEEPAPAPALPAPGEDFLADLAKMEPYMSDATDVDWSREAIYTRMEGE